MYTVSHAITGARYGEPLATLAEAERYGLKLSKSLAHGLNVSDNGSVVAYCYRGEIDRTPSPETPAPASSADVIMSKRSIAARQTVTRKRRK